MNTYIVYLSATGEQIASGTSRDCVESMNLSSIKSFNQLVANVLNGSNKKYKITVFSPSINGLSCPCDICEHQPPNKPKMAASWGCESLCGSWEKWARDYWTQLNKKYGRRKCGRK